MTREEFIKLVKRDLQAQFRQCGLLVGLICALGLVGTAVVNRADDQPLRLDSPALWTLLAITLLFAGLAVVGFRLTGRSLLRCPHCHKCIGGVSAQVVVGCGRCGLCGGRIIDEPESVVESYSG